MGSTGLSFESIKDRNAILAPGEILTNMLLASDRRQARVDFNYAAGIFDSIPLLGGLQESRTADRISLRNRTNIEIHTASFRSIRGYSIGICIADEISFWRDESSANPDVEILRGLRPGLGRVSGSKLLCFSSPYARRGVLWENYRKYFGVENDRVLVWQADTLTMNPLFDRAVIEGAYEADPQVAMAEYGGQFRTDVESFVSVEVVEACTVPGRFELPFLSTNSYTAFCDPAGGSGGDSMTLAVAHSEGQDAERVVLDCVREAKPPFSPDEVVKQFCETLGAYQINIIVGDRYGGEWPRERFRAHGIEYEIAEKSKSEIYQAFLPMLNSRRAELLDNQRLLAQLLGLERRIRSGGRDVVDHAPNQHDDLINVAAGAIFLANTEQSLPGFFFVRAPVIRW